MLITKNYVTFEQAKLLKEKGFEGIEIDYGLNQMLNHSKPPEHWQVVKWLIIEHGIFVNVDCDWDGGLWYVKLSPASPEMWHDLEKRHAVISAHKKFINEHKSPQDAHSAAFDYVLINLI